MADKSISELAVAKSMTDDALLVAYQNGETRSIEGQLIKQYARESTKEYVEGAAQAAKDAAESAETAKTARDGVETYVEQAGESATQAAASAATALEAKMAAESAQAGVAKDAAAAEKSAAAATASEKTAVGSEKNAVASASAAEQAKSSAEAARAAAEAAKISADAAAASAEKKATESSQSAKEAADSATGAAGSAAAAGTAQSGAESARDGAETAKTAAETAQGKSENAQIAAEAARDAAEASETNAGTAAATATEKAAQAGQSVSAAEKAATTAAEKAKEADTSATQAAGNAAMAKGHKDAAGASATAAAGSAGTAKTEADRAKTEADRAAEIVGGDYATKTQAQGYVDVHAEDAQAHKALLDVKADLVDGKVKKEQLPEIQTDQVVEQPDTPTSPNTILWVDTDEETPGVDIDGIKATAEGARAEAELAHAAADSAVTRLNDVDGRIATLVRTDSGQDAAIQDCIEKIEVNKQAIAGITVPDFSATSQLTDEWPDLYQYKQIFMRLTGNTLYVWFNFKLKANAQVESTLFTMQIPSSYPFTMINADYYVSGVAANDVKTVAIRPSDRNNPSNGKLEVYVINQLLAANVDFTFQASIPLVTKV